MTAPSVHDTLVEARRLLTEVGWAQGSFTVWDDSDRIVGYCLMGAVNAASPYALAEHRLACYDRLNEGIVGGLISYNDAPGRTREQVLEVLNRAIAGT